MEKDQLHATFGDPPQAFGVMPFWFWNDDLDEAELVRQIRAFHAKGFGGFVSQARIGLMRDALKRRLTWRSEHAGTQL